MSVTQHVEAVSAYVAAAAGRDAHLPWGKAQAGYDLGSPIHPLLCHVVDVASVAEIFLQEMLPQSTKNRLLEPLGLASGGIEWLAFIVALHDIGKATPPFQRKWQHVIPAFEQLGFDFPKSISARADHGTLGVYLASEALAARGVDPATALRLARAVASHHGSFISDADGDVPLSRAESGGHRWETARAAIVDELVELFDIDSSAPPRIGNDWGFYSILAGFTSVCDWVGSMAEIFVYESPPTALTRYRELSLARARLALAHAGFKRLRAPTTRSFASLFGFSPRPLQAAMVALVDRVEPPFCAIIEAPMGEGKTEAALFVAHALACAGVHDGVYIALPTQATANQMFDRLSSFLEETRPEDRVNLHLVHGEAVFDTRIRNLVRAVYGSGERPGLVCEPWFLSKKRALLAPFGAGTIDQALLGVLRTKHAFVRQFGLAGKTVVLDEVHAYDTYTSTLLDRLVAWLASLGASIVILSATLTTQRRRELLRAFSPTASDQAEGAPYPRLSWVTQAHGEATSLETGRPPLVVALQRIADDAAARTAAIARLLVGGGVVGVICNTVRRAQAIYQELRLLRSSGGIPEGTRLLLMHARFPSEDRRRLEADLVRLVSRDGRARPERLVVVGTQVLEQSLDVDFDVLFTDAAPVDLVLQRAGRLHRHSRARRPLAMEKPQLLLVAPEGDLASVDLSTVGGVYEAYIVRRSLLVLAQKPALRLPDDIEELVERVYGADLRADEGLRLRQERDDFRKRIERAELLAQSRAWPRPIVRDDPFGDLHLILDEDDAEEARMLRAETRLGDPSVEAVCLFGTENSAFLDRARTRPIDLTASPTPETIRVLAHRTVRVSHCQIVRELSNRPCPGAWSDVSVLSRRRPLYFGPKPLEVGPCSVTLDDELGLVIDPKGGERDGVLASD